MSTLSQPYSEQGLQRLPRPIHKKLNQLIRRIRQIAIVKGIFATLATALICLLTIMAIDAVATIFSPVIRWSLTLGGALITLAAAFWWIVRPATQRISLATIARMVEKQHPELQETISSSVELLASDDPDELLGSRELIDEVVKTATRDVESVSPSKEFDASPIKNHALAALCFGGILAALLLLWPKPSSTLLIRAVAPFLELGNAYAETMEVKPGDAVIPKGSDLEIELSIQRQNLDRATVRRLDAGSTKEGVERMNLTTIEENDRRTFVQTFPNVQEDLQYRVHAGNAVSRYYKVQVIDPPAISELKIRYDYPAYTKLPPREEISTTGEIVALENTLVTVTAKLNRPMESTILEIGGEPQEPVAALDSAGANDAETSWRFYLERDQETTWTIRMRDVHGFENDNPSYTLRATRDAAPSVNITSPASTELKLKPTEIVPIEYVAKEDYGFSSVKLLIQKDESEDTIELEQAFPQPNAPGSWIGLAPLQLATLDLSRVRQLTVWVEVHDSLPEQHYGPQKALSQPLTIRLEKYAKSLIEQLFEAQQKEIRDELEEAKKDLAKARSHEINARSRMERERDMTEPTMEALAEARKELSEAEERIRELAEKMEDTLFSERAEEMKEVNEESIKPARESAEEIPLLDRQDIRLEEAKKMEKEIEEAVESIDDIIANLDESRDEVEKLAELTEMANEQQRLATEANQAAKREQQLESAKGEMSEKEQQQAEREQSKDLADWKGDQEDLLRNLAELLKDDPEAASKVLDQQGQNALKLADEAAELAKDQESLQQATEKAQNPEQFEELQKDLMAQLQKMQEQIAEDSQELRADFAAKNPEKNEAKNAMQEATKNARDTARELQKKDLAGAKEEAAKAAEAFEELAQNATDTANQESAKEFTEQMAQGQDPESSNPESSNPESSNPESSNPESSNPESPNPESSNPESSNPESSNPESSNPESSNPQSSDPAPGESKPELPVDAQLANALSELEDRQKAVEQTLDAVEKGQLEEAMAMMQEAISANTASLEEKAEALEKASALAQQNEAKAQAQNAEREFSQAGQKSEQAANSLNQAQQQQDQAQAQAAQQSAQDQGMSPQEAQAQAMAQAQNGETPPAQPTSSEMSNLQNSQRLQQEAKESLQKAAQELAQAAQQLENQSNSLAPTQAAEGQDAQLNAEQLAQSFEEVSQATQAQNAAQAAAQAMQAAQALQKMSASAAKQMGSLPSSFSANAELAQNGQAAMQPSEQMNADSQMTAPMSDALVYGEGEGLPPEIEKLGISSDEWARIQGALQSDVTSEASSGAPQEYQDLVEQYFRLMASEARK